MNRRKRVLFIGEAVTLTHVTRPLVLARSLDPARYEVHFACAERFPFVFAEEEPFQRWNIQSIPSAQFLDSLARGRRLFDYQTLADYADEDQSLIDEIGPDLVVGDYRLSLAVSAVLAKVPYASINNAYWSPFARGGYPMPDMPMVRFLGVTLSNRIFQAVQPMALAFHASPLNRLRRRRGLAPFPDICTANTYGDHVLYADVPGLVPLFDPPANHHYLGPILWSPQTARPDWWDKLPGDHPLIYVTLGSSGRVEILDKIIQALGELPLTTIVATAGRADVGTWPANVRVTDYLPGEEAAARAILVICNGGSGTVAQALNEGVPVLGLPSNIDQYLVMRYVQEAGAGITLRSDCASVEGIRTTIETLLNDASYRHAARVLAGKFHQYNAVERFGKLLGQWLDTDPGKNASVQQETVI